ncbi:MAG TPA: DNA primase large subunit PriL [Methanomassiliicoccales archaeon]|jgi:DNA primase large subunit
MDEKSLARYPFIKGASEIVRNKGVSLADLMSQNSFPEARRRGRKRVLEALNDTKIQTNSTGTEEDILAELLSYPVARMIVSSVGDDFLIRRYAMGEAKTLADRLSTEDVYLQMEVASDLGVSSQLDGELPSMHFCDFLKYTSGIRGKEWKLVNQEVKKGYISLPKVKFARVLEQALDEKIEHELPLPVTEAIIDAFQEEVGEVSAQVEEIRSKYKGNEFGEVRIVNFPPCMKALVSQAQAGKNMPHAGRFAMVTFLNYIGMPTDQIIRTFYTSPDFDNKMTEYQVRHITGDGMGKKYSCPECSTMRTNGICVDQDALCRSGKIRHPLNYYRVKTIEMKRSGTQAKPAEKSKEEKPKK